MNFEIKILAKSENSPSGEFTIRSGVWTASNVHTAVKRAVSGYPCESRKGDIAATGVPSQWTKLKVGEEIRIVVRRI